MFVRGRGAALALAALALAAACSDAGSKPVSLPSISPRATGPTSASPTSTASVATAVTLVLRRYYSLLNAPTTVANGQALAQLMTAGCSCKRVATSTIDVARKRESYFGATRVVSMTPIVDSPTAAEVLVQYDYTAGGIKDDRGAIVSRTSGRHGNQLMFELTLVNDAWLISDVRLIRNGTA